MQFRLSSRMALLALTAGLLLPIVSVLGAWVPWGGEPGQAWHILSEMAATVLPDYVRTTVALCLLVALGVTIIGLGAATAVSLFDFPGRSFFEWALLLPLAMPAYVLAYAYTDFFQFSGPLQTTLRSLWGLQGRVFPEIRNVGGAAWVLTFSLYPYVYLLARAAMSERAATLMEAARMLGAPLSRRIWAVALPLARPAVAAGLALALMETLADYGVSSYFGIQTFTTGIYKAWLVMDNRWAAAQLATLLLGVVFVLMRLEQGAQQRMRFGAARGSVASRGGDAAPVRLMGGVRLAAWLVCAVPVVMGFLAPVLFMARPLVADWGGLPWDRFAVWAGNSLRLGALSAVLAVGLATFLAYSLRRMPDLLTRGVVYLAGLGYAVPGAVIVVGLLLPLGWLQTLWPQGGLTAWVTTTSLGLVWAYLVRFVAVALQSVQSGYARIPASLDDSARMLGVSAWGLLVRVHAPLLKRSVAAALLLVFVDVMKELPATLVLRPFDSDTLAVVAYQLARDERLGEAALPSLALVLAGLLPVILLSRTLRRRSD